jgi:hypothetical protein
MRARCFVTVAAIVVLVWSAGATAASIPVTHPAMRVAQRVTKSALRRGVLCICVTTPAGSLPVASEAELEAQIDVDLISHGLEPVYASLQTTPELQAQYDAVLIAHGLGPYFDGAPGVRS